MNEENTADLTTDETLRLILTELRELKTTVGGMDARVAALEARSEERSGTTRPLLDRIIQEVIETRERLLEEIAAVRREFGVIAADVIALRARGDHAERRLSALEQRPN
jgi:hypothetical protein